MGDARPAAPRVDRGRRPRGGPLSEQFPTAPGVTYRVSLPAARLGEASRRSSVAGAARAEKAPSTVGSACAGRDVVPENLLKFYVEFWPRWAGARRTSACGCSTQRGGRRLAVPGAGRGTLGPQRNPAHPAVRPGQDQNGSEAARRAGARVGAGESYTLMIDPAGATPRGTLSARVSASRSGPGRGRLDAARPSSWKLDPPTAVTREPLPNAVSRTSRPRDAGDGWSVADRAGGPVAGSVEVGADETSWAFTPENAWRVGD